MLLWSSKNRAAVLLHEGTNERTNSVRTRGNTTKGSVGLDANEVLELMGLGAGG